jgi:hypothetical protein
MREWPRQYLAGEVVSSAGKCECKGNANATGAASIRAADGEKGENKTRPLLSGNMQEDENQSECGENDEDHRWAPFAFEARGCLCDCG